MASRWAAIWGYFGLRRPAAGISSRWGTLPGRGIRCCAGCWWSCRRGAEQRCGLARAVFSSVDEPASQRGKMAMPTNWRFVCLGCSLRAELHAGRGARFACGAVRSGRWLRFQADYLIGRPASLPGESVRTVMMVLDRAEYMVGGTWTVPSKVIHQRANSGRFAMKTIF